MICTHLLRLHALNKHPVEEGHDRSDALDGERLDMQQHDERMYSM